MLSLQCQFVKLFNVYCLLNICTTQTHSSWIFGWKKCFAKSLSAVYFNPRTRLQGYPHLLLFFMLCASQHIAIKYHSSRVTLCFSVRCLNILPEEEWTISVNSTLKVIFFQDYVYFPNVFRENVYLCLLSTLHPVLLTYPSLLSYVFLGWESWNWGKLGSHMNCPTLNGLSVVEPGFETEHAGPRAHPFNTVLNVFLSVGKSTKGWVTEGVTTGC